jgi:tetratricopeptide (TPR) repeat protein
MRFRIGMIFVLAAGLGLGGCAAAANGGGGGPLTSPTGRVYEPGIAPTQTNYSRTATLALAQARFDEAIEEARQGIASNPENPLHYYLAGEAAAALGDFELADSMWVVAERIYPAYELEIEPSREAAWAEAFNEGVELYGAGDMSGAIARWRQADMIYRLRPEAAQNLAIVLTQEGEYEEAIAIYRRGLEGLRIEPATRLIEEDELEDREEARRFMQTQLGQLLLFTDQFAEAETLLREQLRENPDDVELQASLATALGRLGREAEAAEIYSRLLTAPDLPAVDLFSIGVALFNSEDFERAAEAFGRVTEIQPESRDAWFNQANALYAAEKWEELIPVGERLIEVDPLNESAALLLTRAYRDLGQNDNALRTLERSQDSPVFLEELQIRPAGQQTTIVGRVIGHEAAPGTPVRLRFTFYDDAGQVGTETVTVTAPAREASEVFEVSIAQTANAYKYELLQ